MCAERRSRGRRSLTYASAGSNPSASSAGLLWVCTCRRRGCKTWSFIGTTTTGSSLVHCKLYWVPVGGMQNLRARTPFRAPPNIATSRLVAHATTAGWSPTLRRWRGGDSEPVRPDPPNATGRRWRLAGREGGTGGTPQITKRHVHRETPSNPPNRAESATRPAPHSARPLTAQPTWELPPSLPHPPAPPQPPSHPPQLPSHFAACRSVFRVRLAFAVCAAVPRPRPPSPFNKHTSTLGRIRDKTPSSTASITLLI